MTKPNLGLLITLGLTAGLLGGCVSMAPDPMMQTARQNIAQAQANGEAVRYAQPDIDRAQQLLDSAVKARQDGYADLADHDAYLSSQIAAVAEQTGEEHTALDRIAAGDAERQQIQLAARDRDLTAAREQAQAAEQRAQNAEASADQATTQQMQTELAALNPQQTDRGLMLSVYDDQFDSDNASLKPDANTTVDQLAQFLNAHPQRRVLVEGHTDSAASDTQSINLSSQRAETLGDALVQRGIAANRIDIANQGMDDGKASNASNPPNRWVEVIISDASGQVASN
jgi:outer membrane protein OmpA-like peptidoglycan-associated protein